MACIEYQMRRDEGLDADLSENNLAATHGFDWGFGEGGNDLMSSAVFLRHADPVAEALDPSDGDIVIAAVDGEFTVKTLRKKGGRVALQPENENYPMIVMKGISELKLFSKVAVVIHRF
jgi:DNA polymerase V